MAQRQSAEERRTQLVQAAIAVMCRDGMPAATTRAIVAEAGMPIGMFHYCFRSKNELLVEVMEVLRRRSFTVVAAVLDRGHDTESSVRLALEAYWEHVCHHPDEHLLDLELRAWVLRHSEGSPVGPGSPGSTAGNPDPACARDHAYRSGLERFLRALADRTEVSWATPVPDLAVYLLAAVDGMTFQWLASRDDASARRFLDRVGAHLIAEVRPAA